MYDPKYQNPYPAQGYYQGVPISQQPNYPPPQYAPPQYAPPRRKNKGFLKGCLAALCCCWVFEECCCDPSIIIVD